MNKLLFFRDEIMEELLLLKRHAPEPKDILVVVHDQYQFVRPCLESVYAHTRDYTLWVWDNGSQEQTAGYLREQADAGRIRLFWSPSNHGFINPNNALFEKGSSPFVILLNSDTVVKEGWDVALTGYLQEHPEVAEVGFMGSKLNAQGMGGFPAFGSEAHYIPAWCACVRRSQVAGVGLNDPTGLFDEENLTFAYGEDSDLSLRLQEAGLGIYALHLDLVDHWGNATIGAVQRELGDRVRRTFESNHAYIRRRWAEFLSKHAFGIQDDSRGVD